MTPDPFFIIVLILMLVSGVIGFAVRTFLHDRREDAELLDFLDQAGYSLQCMNKLWGVTDGGSRLVGHMSDTPRDAIRSAAGALATGKEVQHG